MTWPLSENATPKFKMMVGLQEKGLSETQILDVIELDNGVSRITREEFEFAQAEIVRSKRSDLRKKRLIHRLAEHAELGFLELPFEVYEESHTRRTAVAGPKDNLTKVSIALLVPRESFLEVMAAVERAEGLPFVSRIVRSASEAQLVLADVRFENYSVLTRNDRKHPKVVVIEAFPFDDLGKLSDVVRECLFDAAELKTIQKLL